MGRDLARTIILAEEGDRVPYGILDNACWHHQGQVGPSIAEEMISEGLSWGQVIEVLGRELWLKTLCISFCKLMMLQRRLASYFSILVNKLFQTFPRSRLIQRVLMALIHNMRAITLTTASATAL